MNPKNPYSDLVTMMQSQGTKYNPPFIMVGKVIHPLPDLLIMIGDLQVDSDNLLLAEDLVQHQRLSALAVSTATGLTGQTSVGDHGSHDHNIRQIGYSGGQLSIASCLAKDDLVAVLPLEGYQKYIVLCKVVNLGG